MNFIEGIYMFLFSVICFLTLAMVAWFIIKQVMDDRAKEKVDLEKNRESLE